MADDRVRLAELLGALSLGIDLGFGQPMEHVLRQCWIALRIAELLGVSEEERATVYYSALLVNVGCHTDAHEQAKWFGDDIDLKADKYRYGLHGVRSALASVRRLGAGQPMLQRLRVGLDFTLLGRKELDAMIAGHAAAARSLAGEVGLPVPVQEALGAMYEQWDGQGWPGQLAADAVPIASRIAQLAEYVEVAHRSGGVDSAALLARTLAGSQFDPTIASAFASAAGDVVKDIDHADTWEAVIASEPVLGVPLSEPEVDAALTAIADFVDLKSPYTLGHARGVAELAASAGSSLGIADPDHAILRRAALAHGLGRLGISNAILDKPGPLGPGERERVRLQPFLTERMLTQSARLAPIGRLAGQVRERLDGSGYPRGLTGQSLTTSARVLAAAEVYQAMIEPRPHRAARPPDEAAAELRGEVRAGRLDSDAVEAVLGAAGHSRRVRRERPAGLTEREVDVLRLVARGLSSTEVARQLVISPKTVRNHIEHIYAKTGAGNRVTVSLFATKHGLLSD